MRPYDVLTFDCYGTLIDWERGIAQAFEAASRADGHPVSGHAALNAYLAVEPVVEADGYHAYREVLAVTARRVADGLGWRLAPGRERFLADSLPSWPPFPDTNAALRRLADAGYRLAILSNVDDDLLAATRRHLPVEFEFVVTAQQVRSYKPAPAHFEAAQKLIGSARWLHVAQSYFHDVVPARRLGIAAAWVNRKGARRAGDEQPDAEFGTLTETADWLTSA